jgi:hypothetical protein
MLGSWGYDLGAEWDSQHSFPYSYTPVTTNIFGQDGKSCKIIQPEVTL